MAQNHPGKYAIKLTGERIASLDELGFNWTNRRHSSFDERLADLRSYKEEHGHLDVKWAEDRSLHMYCAKIRRSRNNPGKTSIELTDDRIASLDELGFEWSSAQRYVTKSFD